ncbi:hypothetical protein [Actinomadura chokoriensis]|uniref:hypothetical protein n=1 Tax=Actinomadura chokoriensis TaxID=454156 RepID=UPI0031F792AD
MEMRQRAYGAVRGCAGGRHVIRTPRLVFRTATRSDLRRIAATGAELITAGLALAHRHLHFGEVRAGAEPENLASVHSLWRAGLDPTLGPDRHRLSDGRVIASVWFANVEPNPSRCPSGW